jgi:hypothetical protein
LVPLVATVADASHDLIPPGVEEDEAATLLGEGLERVALDLVKQALRETVHRSPVQQACSGAEVNHRDAHGGRVTTYVGRVRSASWMAATRRALTGVGTPIRSPARTIAPPIASTSVRRRFEVLRASTSGGRRSRRTSAVVGWRLRRYARRHDTAARATLAEASSIAASRTGAASEATTSP